jgi:hypothetical protein
VYGTLTGNCQIDLHRFALVYGDSTISPATTTSVIYGDTVEVTQCGYTYNGFITLYFRMPNTFVDIGIIEIRMCKKKSNVIIIETYGAGIPSTDISLWFTIGQDSHYSNIIEFPVTGSSNTTYIDDSQNISYIWDGIVYVEGIRWDKLNDTTSGIDLPYATASYRFKETHRDGSLIIDCCTKCPSCFCEHGNFAPTFYAYYTHRGKKLTTTPQYNPNPQINNTYSETIQTNGANLVKFFIYIYSSGGGISSPYGSDIIFSIPEFGVSITWNSDPWWGNIDGTEAITYIGPPLSEFTYTLTLTGGPTIPSIFINVMVHCQIGYFSPVVRAFGQNISQYWRPDISSAPIQVISEFYATSGYINVYRCTNVPDTNYVPDQSNLIFENSPSIIIPFDFLNDKFIFRANRYLPDLLLSSPSNGDALWPITYVNGISLPTGIYKIGCILENDASEKSKEQFFLKSGTISHAVYRSTNASIWIYEYMAESYPNPHYVQVNQSPWAYRGGDPRDNAAIYYVDEYSSFKPIYVTLDVELIPTINIISIPQASNVIISHDFEISTGIVYYCEWRFTGEDNYYSYTKDNQSFALYKAGTYHVQIKINKGEHKQIISLPDIVVDTPSPIDPIASISIYLYRAYGYKILRFWTSDDWYRSIFTFDYAGVHPSTTGEYVNEQFFRSSPTPYIFTSDVIGTTGIERTYEHEYTLSWEIPYIEPITITSRSDTTITFRSPDWMYERQNWKDWSWDFGDGTIIYVTVTVNDPHTYYPTFTKIGDEDEYGQVTHAYTIFKEFTNNAERDEYFTINPTLLTEGLHIKVNGFIRRYHANRWNYPQVTLTVTNDVYTASGIKGFE